MLTTTQTGNVLATFSTAHRALMAIDALRAAGVEPDSISVLSPSPQTTEALTERAGISDDFEEAVEPNPLEALVGWLAGIGGLTIPGVGPTAAGGTLATTLNAARAGEGEGALIGALVGFGLSVDEASRYEEALRHGATLVSVEGPSDRAEVTRLLAASAD